jgi:predicted O-linked N-acetylglucosamine transferase (SPINDLY family)
LIGRTVVGRAGLSQLANLGMENLAAKTPEEFVRLASDLAGDLPALEAMRRSLRDRMTASPLCDTRQFTADFQSLLRQLWRDWCAGQNEAGRARRA